MLTRTSQHILKRTSTLTRGPTTSRGFTSFTPIAPKPRPIRTILQITAIALTTVGVWVTYNVSNGKSCFLPFWVSKSKGVPTHDEIDMKYVKQVAEEQILERLSLDTQIQREFRLPIKTRLHDDFKVWTEDKNVSVKGVEVRPGFRFKYVKKPVKVKPDFDVLMENLGGEERFEIPVVNQNMSRNDDIWFLGTVTVEGQNKQTADVVFKGIFDAEHAKQARIFQAHLIKVVDGNKVRERLWDK